MKRSSRRENNMRLATDSGKKYQMEMGRLPSMDDSNETTTTVSSSCCGEGGGSACFAKQDDDDVDGNVSLPDSWLSWFERNMGWMSCNDGTVASPQSTSGDQTAMTTAAAAEDKKTTALHGKRPAEVQVRSRHPPPCPDEVSSRTCTSEKATSDCGGSASEATPVSSPPKTLSLWKSSPAAVSPSPTATSTLPVRKASPVVSSPQVTLKTSVPKPRPPSPPPSSSKERDYAAMHDRLVDALLEEQRRIHQQRSRAAESGGVDDLDDSTTPRKSPVRKLRATLSHRRMNPHQKSSAATAERPSSWSETIHRNNTHSVTDVKGESMIPSISAFVWGSSSAGDNSDSRGEKRGRTRKKLRVPAVMARKRNGTKKECQETASIWHIWIGACSQQQQETQRASNKEYAFQSFLRQPKCQARRNDKDGSSAPAREKIRVPSIRRPQTSSKISLRRLSSTLSTSSFNPLGSKSTPPENDAADLSSLLPSPSSLLHQDCCLQKDKGNGMPLGTAIAASGRDATLSKVGEKLAVLGEIEAGVGSTARAEIKRHGAVQAISSSSDNVVETRSMLVLRMGFLNMRYGILLKWDAADSGLVSLVVLRKMCSSNFISKVVEEASPASEAAIEPCAKRQSVSFNRCTVAGDEVEGATGSMECTQSSMMQMQMKGRNRPSLALRRVVVGANAVLDRTLSLRGVRDSVEVVDVSPPYLVSRPDEFPPTTLLVKVLSARGLHSDVNKGNRNSMDVHTGGMHIFAPYVRLSLGEDTHSTSSVFFSRGNPSWTKRHRNFCSLRCSSAPDNAGGEDEELKVELCNKRVFGPDEVLGVVYVPLASIEPQPDVSRNNKANDGEESQEERGTLATEVTLPCRIARHTAGTYCSVTLSLIRDSKHNEWLKKELEARKRRGSCSRNPARMNSIRGKSLWFSDSKRNRSCTANRNENETDVLAPCDKESKVDSIDETQESVKWFRMF